jgi:hypothetical protein
MERRLTRIGLGREQMTADVAGLSVSSTIAPARGTFRKTSMFVGNVRSRSTP